jgi:hypothetical protein
MNEVIQLTTTRTIVGTYSYNIATEDPNSPGKLLNPPQLLTHVAVQDCHPDFPEGATIAVYFGIGSPVFVAEHGTKLTFKEAKMLFPTITEDKYRH